MQVFDLLLRVGTASLLLGLALLLAAKAPRARLVRFFLPFAVGLTAFLARNTPFPELQPTGFAAEIASVLSGVAAIFVWWFCAAVYDDEFRLRRFELSAAALWVVLALLDRGLLWPELEDVGLSWALIGLGVVMIAGVAWRIVRGRADDLVEGRRRTRAFVAAALVGLLVTDFAADALMGFAWKPSGFTLAQNAAVLGLTAVLAIWTLRADADALGAPARPTLPASRASASPPPSPLRRRLDALIARDRVHLDPDLAFPAFARQLAAPEAAVRELINRELGHRHFRTFLNALRVEEAKRALADPAGEAKVASVAFDCGFASLATFNRVFKEATGLTPSDYRAAALLAPADDLLSSDRSKF